MQSYTSALYFTQCCHPVAGLLLLRQQRSTSYNKHQSFHDKTVTNITTLSTDPTGKATGTDFACRNSLYRPSCVRPPITCRMHTLHGASLLCSSFTSSPRYLPHHCPILLHCAVSKTNGNHPCNSCPGLCRDKLYRCCPSRHECQAGHLAALHAFLVSQQAGKL